MIGLESGISPLKDTLLRDYSVNDAIIKAQSLLQTKQNESIHTTEM
jgi:hypothetical protein